MNPSAMKRRLLVLATLSLVTMTGVLSTTSLVNAKPGMPSRSVSKPNKTRGMTPLADDKNVKDPNKKGDPKMQRPASKGGKKSRSGESRIHIDNESHHYIDIWINGYYEGTMAPWGDMYFTADAGAEYQLYGRISDGSGTYGPITIRLYSGSTYDWALGE